MWRRLPAPVRWLVVLAILAVPIWLVWPPLAMTMPPGVLAPADPVQVDLTVGPTWTREELLITGVATFELTAKVLGRERYWMGREASLSPIDLALGWGPMSNQAIVDQIDVSQGGRWYQWSTSAFPIAEAEIVSHSANMHILPANPAVEAFVMRARPGQIIGLAGHLVEVRADDGWHWRSSLTRLDTGDHSCEVFWVERAWDPLVAGSTPVAP